MGGDARDRVAGFWRALGEEPPTEPDHLAALLGLYANLVEAEKENEAAGRARAAMLWEHLACWLPPWIDKFREIATPAYGAWATLLAELLREEARRTPPLEGLPLHLREAPALPDPRDVHGGSRPRRQNLDKEVSAQDRDGAVDFIPALLAPVRSGMILTRSDLARMASVLGLGVRAGERAYALRALVDQDGEAVVGWLKEEASGWAKRHEATNELDPEVAAFWIERARRTERTLAESEIGPGVEPVVVGTTTD